MLPKTKRNKNILELKDKKDWSFSQIGEEFNISKQTAHEIYHREKARQELSPEKA